MSRARLALGFGMLAGCQVVFSLEDPDLASDCSEMRMVATRFDNETILPWVNERASQFTLQDEQLVTTVNNAGATVVTGAFYDIRNSAIEVRTGRDTLDPQGFMTMALTLVPVPDRMVDAVAIRAFGPTLEVGTFSAGNFTPLKTIENPVDKPLWRISYVGGQARFTVADDAGAVIEVATLDVDMTFVRPSLQADNFGVNPFVVRFDDINGGVPSGRACSARVLDDTFTDPMLDLQRWGRNVISNCTLTLGDGMRFTSIGSNWGCTIGSTTIHDLLDRSLEVEIEITPPPVFPTNFGFEINVQNIAGQRAGFQLRGDNGQFGSFFFGGPPAIDATPIRMIPYNPAMHRFWRMSASRNDLGDTLVFEVSADGTTYESFLETGNLPGLDQVVVTMGHGGVNPEQTHSLRVVRVTAR